MARGSRDEIEDIDDEMEIDEGEEIESGHTPRWVSLSVMLLAAASFSALAWYAYTAGNRSVSEEEVLLVEADAGPIKEKPLDPGGMKVPHQDKTIFDAISANAVRPAVVERVMPAPEEPVSRDQLEAAARDSAAQSPSAGETVSWVNESGQQQAANQPADAAPGSAPLAPVDVTPVEIVAPVSAPVQADQLSADSSTSPTPEQVMPKVVAKSDVSSTLIADKAPAVISAPVELKPSAGGNDPAPKAATSKVVRLASLESPAPVSKPAATPKSTAKAVAGPAGWVQLGAYRSETEAQKALSSIVKKHKSLAGAKTSVERADLGAKGVFYRARASVASAKSVCASLSASGQPCIVVK